MSYSVFKNVVEKKLVQSFPVISLLLRIICIVFCFYSNLLFLFNSTNIYVSTTYIYLC